MADRNLSQGQINRRKKAQAHISQTTGALGLGAVGVLGASKIPGSNMGMKLARTAAKTPKGSLRSKALKPLVGQSSRGLKDKSTALATTGAGIGGVGAFNFASYSAAEARQRKPKSVVGSAGRPVSKAERIQPAKGKKAPVLSPKKIGEAVVGDNAPPVKIARHPNLKKHRVKKSNSYSLVQKNHDGDAVL